MRVPARILAALALLAGCTYDPKIPPGRVSCRTTGECPAGFTCEVLQNSATPVQLCCRTPGCANENMPVAGAGAPDAAIDATSDGGPPGQAAEAGAPSPDASESDRREASAFAPDGGTFEVAPAPLDTAAPQKADAVDVPEDVTVDVPEDVTVDAPVVDAPVDVPEDVRVPAPDVPESVPDLPVGAPDVPADVLADVPPIPPDAPVEVPVDTGPTCPSPPAACTADGVSAGTKVCGGGKLLTCGLDGAMCLAVIDARTCDPGKICAGPPGAAECVCGDTCSNGDGCCSAKCDPGNDNDCQWDLSGTIASGGGAWGTASGLQLIDDDFETTEWMCDGAGTCLSGGITP